MIIAPQTTAAMLVGTFQCGTNVYVQVITGSIRISNKKEILETPGPAYTNQGIALSPSAGLKRLVWNGPFWIIADTANSFTEITAV